MIFKRSALVDRIFIILLMILVLVMLSCALYVGLTPPASSEPIEPYNIQHATPVSAVIGGP
jgi:hypothetical protein